MLSLKASIIRSPKTGEEKLKLDTRYITKDGVVPIAALREEIPFPGARDMNQKTVLKTKTPLE